MAAVVASSAHATEKERASESAQLVVVLYTEMLAATALIVPSWLCVKVMSADRRT